jgi:L-cystine transport system permease protein
MGQPFDISYLWEFIPKLLPFLKTTLLIVAGSVLLGLVVGFLVALPRLYNIPVLKRVSAVYVSFFRGTPILVQLFLIYYGLPEFLKLIHLDVSKWNVLIFVIFTYTLNSAAFISEIIRAAVNGVDRGQVEASYSIGMTGYQAFTRIIAPQALSISIPVFANSVIALLKDTSLAFSLGVMDLTGKSQTLGLATQHFIEVYIDLSLIYLAISLVLERLFKKLETRLQRHELRIAAHEKPFRPRAAFVQLIITRFGRGG